MEKGYKGIHAQFSTENLARIPAVCMYFDDKKKSHKSEFSHKNTCKETEK